MGCIVNDNWDVKFILWGINASRNKSLHVESKILQYSFRADFAICISLPETCKLLKSKTLADALLCALSVVFIVLLFIFFFILFKLKCFWLVPYKPNALPNLHFKDQTHIVRDCRPYPQPYFPQIYGGTCFIIWSLIKVETTAWMPSPAGNKSAPDCCRMARLINED